MATVKKLPSGKWNALAYYKDPVTGKVHRPSFTANSKAEAIRMAAEWESKRTRSPEYITVKECIERYIKAKESTLSPSTIRGYRIDQRNRYQEIENIAISALTDEILQRFVSNLCLNHSPKTVRNTYALLTSSLQMFTDRRYHVTLPQKRPPELHVPNDDDVKTLLEIAEESLKIAIVLAAVGTARAGEVAALKYRDVKKDGIHIHSDMIKDQNNQWIIKEVPKTSASDRYVPLPEKVMQMLGTGDPDDFVYGRTPAAINRAFTRLRDKLGLKCRYHDLRHYAASIMHALGVPDQYIMERGGWKSDAVLKAAAEYNP